MSSRARALAAPLAAFLIGLAALVAAAYLSFAPADRAVALSSVGGPFRLTDDRGRPASDTDFLGAPYLVFFGFTHCPDICPTKLFEISEVLRAMGDKGPKVRALFVTVDPERDTAEVLRSYVSSFDPRIVGLTGDRPAVEAAMRAYRAYGRKVPTESGDYTMEHTALVYLMDSRGRFVGSFNLQRPPGEAARDLLRHL